MNSASIVCVGSHLESQVALEGLFEANVPIAGLVTLPSGSSAGVSDYVDLHPLCEDSGVPVIDTTDINSVDTLARIRELAPNYIFTLGWNRLFKDDLLSIPDGFVVGSHPTRLPDGRGRAPIPWTILRDARRSASTLFKMDLEVDSGGILVQNEFDVPPRSYAYDVYMLASRAMRDGFIQLYHSIVAGKPLAARPQDSSLLTIHGKRTPMDGRVDWQGSADAVDRLIRAVSYPYPGAYSYYDGQRISIWRVDRTDGPPCFAPPGQVLERDDERILVMAGDEPVWLSEFTVEGDRLPAATFRVGTRFGYALEDEIHHLRGELAALKESLRE